MSERRITLTGQFTDDELGELLGFMRRCDERDPARTITILIASPDATVEQMEQLMRAGLPEQPDRETTIRVVRTN